MICREFFVKTVIVEMPKHYGKMIKSEDAVGKATTLIQAKNMVRECKTRIKTHEWVKRQEEIRIAAYKKRIRLLIEQWGNDVDVEPY
jgi:hypothetical protein